jgi:hypothetical protein
MKRSLYPLAAAALLLPMAAPAQAQDGFLFGRPDVQLTLRTGPVMHRAHGDLFEFMTTELTLERGDFTAASFGGELGVSLHPRVDLSLGLGVAHARSRSEFRDWVTDDDLPIEQTTQLRTMPGSVSARFYPLSRGRAVSSLAWLPARTTPYVGGGLDMVWYRLEQFGDFVAPDASINAGSYTSSGSALGGHVRAGLDHWLTPRVGLNLDARYRYGSARPGDDFGGWNSLDLSGMQAGVGLSLRW